MAVNTILDPAIFICRETQQVETVTGKAQRQTFIDKLAWLLQRTSSQLLLLCFREVILVAVFTVPVLQQGLANATFI
jgi:hypothetical protein